VLNLAPLSDRLAFQPLSAPDVPEVQIRGNPVERRNFPVREYELVFIVHPDLEEAAFNELVERVQGWITDAGGSLTKVDVWGKRKLAYEIKKQHEGQYVLMRAQMNPEFSAELERNFRYLEPVMRFLITSAE
jgi:small subunit ribosomal protein S6